MKRTLAFLLSLLLLLALPLSLVGCGKDTPDDGEDTGDEEIITGITNETLQNAVIVTPDSPTVIESRTAGMLAKHLASIGFTVPVVKKKDAAATGVKFLIGTSICEKAKPTGANGYDVKGNGNTLEIAANSSYGYEAALERFTSKMLRAKSEIEINDDSKLTGNGDLKLTATVEKEGDVRILYNNVYGGNHADIRMAMLYEVYKTYAPDVICMQEYHDNVRKYMDKYLTDGGYTEVKFNRSSINTGASVNSTPIYYDADKLTLVDSGFLFYERDVWVASPAYNTLRGSLPVTGIIKNDYSKTLTWAIFRVTGTDHYFTVGSTHLCWDNSGNYETVPETWRKMQIAGAKEALFSAADTYVTANLPGKDAASMPIFFGGDMNTHPGYGSFTALASALPSLSGNYPKNNMKNVNELAPEGKRITYSTNHHGEGNYNEKYNIYDTPHSTKNEPYENSLDYIFTNMLYGDRDVMTVNRSAEIFDLFAQLATDHAPIFADITLGDLRAAETN